MLLFIIAACNPEPDNGDQLPVHIAGIDSLVVLTQTGEQFDELVLEKIKVYNDSLHLNEILSVAIDKQSELLVAGKSWNRTKVFRFASEGTLLDSIGSYGVEFGQFREIGNLQIFDSNLLITDRKLNRVTRYDIKSAELTDTVDIQNYGDHLPENWEGFQYSVEAAFSEDSLYLVSYRRERNPAYETEGDILYYLVHPYTGVVSDTVLEQKDKRYLVGDYAGRPVPFTLPFPERPLLHVSNEGLIYSAFTDEFLINIHDSTGRRLYSYYMPFERFDLDPEEIIHPRFSHNEQLLRVRESALYPEYWPVLYSMISDDENRIWISTITEDRGVLKWWVIDNRSGNIVGTIKLPPEKQVAAAKNNFVYVIEQNTMGFKEVVKYRIKNQELDF